MSEGAPPPAEVVRFAEPAGRWVLTATVLGSGVAMITATVVNIALPAIGSDLGADVVGLQWIVNAYLLSLASLILLGGSIGDHYGRRRVFVLGILGFAVTSLLCAVAWNLQVLIIGRVLQGVAGALLTPGSLAIIQASFHPSDRGAAIGAWSALGGVAAAIGPLVGGYLVDAVSWRAVFVFNIPLALIVAWIAARHVPETRDPTATGQLDYPGAAIGALGLAALSWGLLQMGGRGLGDPVVLMATLGGVAALAAFVLYEHRTDEPMLPPGIFASRVFSGANLLTFVVYAALGGVFFLLVVYLQTVLGYSALEAGAASLPITVLMLLLSARSGALAQRIGPRLPLTVGPLLLAGAMLLMATIGTGDGYWTGVLPAMIVFGLGLAATVAPVTATALAAAPAEHAGVASGVNNAVSRAAQLLAVAVLPAVGGLTGDAYNQPDVFTAGFRTSMMVAAGLAVAGAVVGWVMIDENVLADADEDGETEYCSGCPIDGAPLTVGERASAGPR